jgi:hypothetical protein
MEVKSFDFLDFMGLVMNFLVFFIKVNVFWKNKLIEETNTSKRRYL